MLNSIVCRNTFSIRFVHGWHGYFHATHMSTILFLVRTPLTYNYMFTTGGHSAASEEFISPVPEKAEQGELKSIHDYQVGPKSHSNRKEGSSTQLGS